MIRYTAALLAMFMILACNSKDNAETATPDETVTQSETVNQSPEQSTTVSDAQQRLRNRAKQIDEADQTQGYKLNVEPYNYFLNESGNLDLIGVEDTKLDQILGQSPVLVRQAVAGAPLRREVRVYLPYEEDSTGLYIFIRNNTVESFRMDTFLGLGNSSMIQDYFTN